MQCLWYIDPDAPPWRTSDEPVTSMQVGATIPLRGDGYTVDLHFARKGKNTGKFYLVACRTTWDHPDLEGMARSLEA